MPHSCLLASQTRLVTANVHTWDCYVCVCVCDVVLLLYNSSSQLATDTQSVVGLSTSSFSLVFELYVQPDQHHHQQQQLTPCSAGAQLTLVVCSGSPGHHELVLHFGINGTQRSEIRQREQRRIRGWGGWTPTWDLHRTTENLLGDSQITLSYQLL